jgi:hypothetical protein
MNKDAAVRRQKYLRPPGSYAATDGVIGTTMKRRIHRHLINHYLRLLRPLRVPKPKWYLLLSKSDTAADRFIRRP